VVCSIFRDVMTPRTPSKSMSAALTEKSSPRKRRQRSSSVQIHPKRLAPLPTSKSRKQARKVTTLFHRYTQLKEKAESLDERRQIDSLIEQIGGRKAYQRASQISTSYHSTSKWVLGCLARNGWLYGIADTTQNNAANCVDRRIDRRPTRILEIGAINTELIDAAAALAPVSEEVTMIDISTDLKALMKKKYCLQVRAIDLHSSHDSVEQVDFLSLPLQSDNVIEDKYDVIVCSMVLNCVPSPIKRGEMLLRVVHFLRPGGLVFITLPKACLNLSPYLDFEKFTQLLRFIGLEVINHSKDTPKLAFFIGKKTVNFKPITNDPTWFQVNKIRQGKKYRNVFSILLPKADRAV
jgi:25S rRNA (adenine2142-N1)-methyltransferase